jgi:hypothetical protein
MNPQLHYTDENDVVRKGSIYAKKLELFRQIQQIMLRTTEILESRRVSATSFVAVYLAIKRFQSGKVDVEKYP